MRFLRYSATPSEQTHAINRAEAPRNNIHITHDMFHVILFYPNLFKLHFNTCACISVEVPFVASDVILNALRSGKRDTSRKGIKDFFGTKKTKYVDTL